MLTREGSDVFDWAARGPLPNARLQGILAAVLLLRVRGESAGANAHPTRGSCNVPPLICSLNSSYAASCLPGDCSQWRKRVHCSDWRVPWCIKDWRIISHASQ